MKNSLLKISKPLFCVILIQCLVSCDILNINDPKPKTELEKLPPITQEGKNTFGFLVNGKAAEFKSTLNFSAIYQGGGVQISGGGVSIIIIDPITVNQSYNLSDAELYKARYTKQQQDGSFCFYEFENTYEGTLTFSKIDKTNYIISGIFEFTTVTSDCETIKITNGRFDMQYIP